jgi:hypothetical protein
VGTVVTAAPNLTQVSGVVVNQGPSAGFEGWTDVEVLLDAVEPVPGMRSMVRAEPGSTVCIAMPAQLYEGDHVGAHLDCRVSVTRRGLRCEPHPQPEDFTLRPAGRT